MALAVDATSTKGAAAVTGSSMTWNHTTASGTNRLLVVQIAQVSLDGDTFVASVTYNGVAMRRIQSIRDFGGSELFSSQYILVAPATGTNAILVTFSAAIVGQIVSGSAITITGAHQTYPVRLSYESYSGTTTTTSWSVTSADSVTGDIVVGLSIGHNSTITQNGSQTVITTQNAFGVGTNTSWASAYKSATGATSLAWTQGVADVQSSACVAIRPDTETPSTPVPDNTGQSIGGLTSSTITITNFVMGSGLNSLLFVGVGYTGGSGGDATHVTGVTFGGVALTKLDSDQRGNTNAKKNTEIWYIKSPSASTADIVITLSASAPEYSAGAVSYFLVDQSSTFGTVAKAGSSSLASVTVTVTSQTGAVVQDIGIRDDDSAPNGAFFPTGAWCWSTPDQVNGNDSFSQVKPGAASVTMNWTGNTSAFSLMGVGINFSSTTATALEESNFSPSQFTGFDPIVSVWQ